VGHTVSKIIETPDGTVFVAVAPSPGNAPNQFDGAYKSIDRGYHWTELDLPDPDTNIYVSDLEYTVAPNHQITLYAGLGNVRSRNPYANDTNGIWRSDDMGNTWQHLVGQNAPLGAHVGRISLATDHSFAANPIVYAAVATIGGDDNDKLMEVISTNNRGANWNVLVNRNLVLRNYPGDNHALLINAFGEQAWYNLSIGVPAGSPNTVYLAGQWHTFRSTNGGATWYVLDGFGTEGNPTVNPHVDHHAWAFAGNAAYDGNDGGIFKFTPGQPNAAGNPGTWVDLNTGGIGTMLSNSADIIGSGQNQVLLEGSQDNGIARKTGNQGTLWSVVQGGDGGRVRFASNRTGRPYAYSDLSGQFNVSIDDGQSWTAVTNKWNNGPNGQLVREAMPAAEYSSYPAVYAITHSFTGPNLVVLGGTAAVWMLVVDPATPLANLTWWPKNGLPGQNPLDLGGAKITAITFGSDDRSVYVGFSNGALWYTPDITGGVAHWTRVDVVARGDAGWGNQPITSLNCQAGSYVDVTLGGNSAAQKAYWVQKIGDRFERVNVSRGLPNVSINCSRTVVVGNTVYDFVGTDNGVYYRDGFTWVYYGQGLPLAAVRDLRSSGNVLIATTYGRGVYQLTLPNPRPVALEADQLEEGIDGTGIFLGTFGDSGSGPYSVVINWGDGTALDSTTGSVALSGGDYVVTGEHTFANPGSYDVSAVVTAGGNSITLSATINVAEEPLAASPQTLSGAAWSAITNVLVATFTDGDAAVPASSYRAIIDWGDNSTSTGIVTGSGGSFSVRGNHQYLNGGPYTVTVIVIDQAGASAAAYSTANISNIVSAQIVPLAPTEGTSTGASSIATFTATSSGSFTAQVNWGDGHVSTGTVTSLGGNSYNITASNTYGQTGGFPMVVTILNAGTPVAVITNQVSVNDALLTTAGLDQKVTQGITVVNAAVARFSDANAASSPLDYTAAIVWGDGNSSVGAVLADGSGNFVVTGSNTYVKGGSYVLSVYLQDAGGSATWTMANVSVMAAIPLVQSVSPNFANPVGGSQVVISGQNLVGATAVSFGGTPATTFTANSDGSITAIAPSGSPGTVDITVTTPAGTSATSTADLFSWVNAAPAVAGLSATTGPTGGGNTITITGTSVADVTQVLFGGTPAPSFVVSSGTTISAVVPAELVGTVDVTLASPYGQSATSSSDHYSFVSAAPTVTGVSPAAGPAAGGQVVGIYGANFNSSGAAQVMFGTNAATGVTVVSSTYLYATAPAASVGPTDVQVTTSYGTSATSSADLYTYVAAPTVAGLSTSTGSTDGGTAVTISGTGFTNASAVYFGSTQASFTVNSATSISAVAPSGTPGTVDVTVVATGGSSATGSADQYTWVATAPSVTGIIPSVGPTAGGTTVTINGSNLGLVTQVSFGSVAAPSFSVVSGSQITAVAPAEAAGTVHITLTNPYGTSSTSSADQFTYADAAAPTVTGISVSSGPMAGGTSVVLTGTSFTGAYQVYFGSTLATSFTVNSATQITVTAPAQAAGVQDITVVTPYGVSATSLADQYTYLTAAPAVAGLSTNSGTTAGGTSVTISGSNLTGATRVYFGTVLAPSFTVNSDSSITVTSPVQATGTCDVVVVTPWGTSSTSSADQFAYTAASGLPVVSGLSASSGPTGGGTVVTISGSGFSSAQQVLFGTQNAAAFVVTSDSSITATAPPEVAGSVDVRVVAASGYSATGSADHFTFQNTAPAITAVSPASGPTTGGTVVQITGSNFFGATAVSFGSTAASSWVLNSPSWITATAPAGSAGTVDIQVTTAGGTSSSVTADHFLYVTPPAPTLVDVGPRSGPMAGGTTVTLVGTHLSNASQVLFGNVAASFSVISDTQINATAPAEVAGTVAVTVVTPSGTSTAVAKGQYTYNAAAPSVTSLGTTSGPTNGGTLVTVSGSNFMGTQGVFFGGVAAPVFSVNGVGSISAVTPAASPGTVDVTVVSPNGTSAAGSADHFTYTAASGAPTVSALGTTSGPDTGGTTLTITGTGLAGATSVMFGSVAASSFSLLSSTSISAVAPMQAVGTVDVTVTSALGTSATSSADQFTYQTALPTVTSLSSSTATTAGGGWITIMGSNFNGTQSIGFGPYGATQFNVLSNTSLSVLVPIAAAGTVDVRVTNADGQSAVSAGDSFTYTTFASTPTITGISPASGPTGGGGAVTISGTNFTGAVGVLFGPWPATTFTVVNSTTITTTAPAALAGTVDVSVLTPSGLTSAVPADHYVYSATAPAVTAISPSSGPSAGGTVVTITGTNLNTASQVEFGGTAATSFVVLGSTQISATAPAGSGSRHITVVTSYGTSASTAADLFTYQPAPTVTSINTTSGTTLGGTVVTVTGTNFTGMVSVSFGGTPAAAITVNTSTQLTATSPAQYAGPVDITVTNPYGTSGTSSADVFTFVTPVPTVSGVSPSYGQVAGGGNVTITGSGFTGAQQVYIGQTPATSFTVNSDTQITAGVPAAAASAVVDVTVAGSAGGTSATSSSDLYTYGLVANDDTAQTVQNNAVTVNVLSNDYGPPGFTIQSVTQPSHGTVTINAGSTSVLYTPSSGYLGVDVFTYTTTDSSGDSDTADVTVTVGQPQLAAGGPAAPGGNPPEALTAAELAPIVQQAEQHLAVDLGVPVDASLLNFVNFHVTSLQNGILGITWQHDIWIDQAAAGYGWYIGSNSAFGPSSIGQDRLAGVGSAAVGKMDLETVVEHELAHVLGFASVDAAILPNNLMTATLEAGVRRTEMGSAEILAPATPLLQGETGKVVDAVFGGQTPVVPGVPMDQTVSSILSGSPLVESRQANPGDVVFAGAALAGMVDYAYPTLARLDPPLPAVVADPSAQLVPLGSPADAFPGESPRWFQDPGARCVLIGDSDNIVIVESNDGTPASVSAFVELGDE
jgi:hypothetical protein